VIAAHFGTSSDYDIYLVAVTLPMIVYSVTRYALPNIFIPIFSKFKTEVSEKRAWSFFWVFLNFNLILFLGVALLVFLLSSQLLEIIAPGLDSDQISTATVLLRIAVIIVVIGGIETALRSLLHSYKHFIYPAFAPILYNLAIIMWVFFLSSKLATKALVWGTVSGALLQMMVLSFAFFKRKVSFPFNLKIYDEGIREAMKVAPFILLIEGFGQLYVLVDRFFASSLPEGSISALNYANLIFLIPLSVFAIAISTAVFPYLAEEAAKGDWSKLTDIFSKTLKMIIFLTIPISLFLIFFHQPITALIFQRGAFDSQSTLMTSKALVFYALGLFFFSGYALIMKMFYSLNLVKTLVVANLLSFSLKLISSLILVNLLSYKALALTTAFAGIFNFCFLFLILNKRIGSLNVKDIMRVTLKTLFISAISIGMGFALFSFFDPKEFVSIGKVAPLLRLSFVSVVILAIFFTCSFWLKMKESKQLKDLCVSYYNKLW
ncbi:MAG: murein biosynthesis integral membrane protein MurJ, partial [candidate division Zixibacteria bacterium]|nr:murein biosynthesis integral membrane protein MurJ [candidate division Zixibacteria bacterium]